MGYDDGACEAAADGTHVWILSEVHGTLRGADTTSVCRCCGVPAYEPGQAAVRDRRPPLAGTGET